MTPRSTSKFSSTSARDGTDVERERQLTALLDRLDAKDAADEGRLGRRNARATYRRSDVHVVLHHPGGSITERRVLTRDLSAGGLSFLHGGYLHVGTRCDVTLRRYVGGEDSMRGTVQHCGHIAGSWHTVGVKFERRVFPKLYLDPEHAVAIEADARDPATVSGRVLLLDDNELDRRLMQHHLRRTKIELTGVGRLDQACEAVSSQTAERPFMLAIVDLNLADDEASHEPDDIVKRVLSLGVPRVAACTAECDPARLKRVRAAGACGILNKPYDPERLLGNVAMWLGDAGGGAGRARAGDEQIFSTLAGQVDMRPLIAEFVAKAHAGVELLRKAMQADNLEQCRSFCILLRGGGTSFGFPQATDAAAEAVTSLDATMSVAEATTALQRLQEICGRLSAESEASTDRAARAA